MEEGAKIKHSLKKSPVTGYWRYARPVVDKKKCIGCGACVKYCPEAVIELINCEEKIHPVKSPPKRGPQNAEFNRVKKADIDYCFCKGCGVCAAECPQKAIKMEKV